MYLFVHIFPWVSNSLPTLVVHLSASPQGMLVKHVETMLTTGDVKKTLTIRGDFLEQLFINCSQIFGVVYQFWNSPTWCVRVIRLRMGSFQTSAWNEGVWDPFTTGSGEVEMHSDSTVVLCAPFWGGWPCWSSLVMAITQIKKSRKHPY